jgi:Bacterial EndoU nuclease
MKRTLIVLGALALAAAVYYTSEYTSESKPPAGPPPLETPPPAAAPAPEAPAAPAPSTVEPTPGIDLGDGKWSATRPAVNLEHIFEGEVNKRGKPVGYHSRPGGKDPDGARVVRIVEGPNQTGVYIADVEIRNESGRWLKKRSTFYPDRLSREAVVAAILHAWNQRTKGRNNPFRGPSGEGFEIEGRPLDGGDINTAYPIFDAGE